MKLFAAVLISVAGSVCASITNAADGTDAPIGAVRFLVPFPAGASNDIYARLVGRQLSDGIGSPVVVDNRPGASGLLATELLANSPPDGRTIMIHSSSLVTAIAVQPKTQFDPFKGITPIIELAVAPLILTVSSSLPAKNVQELLAIARSKPGSLNYGSSGVGSILHLGSEVLNRAANIQTTHVSFKGGAPAVVALASGEVQFYLTPVLDVMPQIKTGKVRAIAVSSSKRSAFLPDLPTIAESGVPGYSVNQWFGVFAPGGTPEALIRRLNAEMAKSSRLQELQDRFADAGAETVMSTPEAFAAIYRNDIAMWRKVVQDAGIKPE